MSDIIERLRKEAVNWSATCGDLFGEAADEIERLRADYERLRAIAGPVEITPDFRAVREKIVIGMAKELGVKFEEQNG